MRLRSSKISKGTPAESRLVHALSIALRTAEIHEPDNGMVVTVISELLAALGHRSLAGTVTVTVRNRCVFVNDDRVLVGPSDYLNFRYLVALFDRWSMGGLALGPGLDPQEATQLVFQLVRAKGDNQVALQERLRERLIQHAEVLPPPMETDQEERNPLKSYVASLEVCREMHETVRGHGQISTRRLRRITQTVVDQLLEDEYALLALTTIKQYDDYLFNHSANVAILSVALGQRLGFSRSRLGELCLAAFLHDMGKLQVAKEILGKPAALEDHEWEEMKEHPLHAVHLLLEQEHLTQSTLRAIVAGFEHHLNADMTGYPVLRQKKAISVFGRIISLTDRYDAITTPRTYRKKTLTPHEGIRYLQAHAGTQFDPLLVRVFIDVMGIYPPGTVVGMSTGEVGVVRRPPLPGSPFNRPLVQLMEDCAEGAFVDIAERAPTGDYLRDVRIVLNPGNIGPLPLLHGVSLLHADN